MLLSQRVGCKCEFGEPIADGGTRHMWWEFWCAIRCWSWLIPWWVWHVKTGAIQDVRMMSFKVLSFLDLLADVFFPSFEFENSWVRKVCFTIHASCVACPEKYIVYAVGVWAWTCLIMMSICFMLFFFCEGFLWRPVVIPSTWEATQNQLTNYSSWTHLVWQLCWCSNCIFTPGMVSHLWYGFEFWTHPPVGAQPHSLTSGHCIATKYKRPDSGLACAGYATDWWIDHPATITVSYI